MPTDYEKNLMRVQEQALSEKAGLRVRIHKTETMPRCFVVGVQPSGVIGVGNSLESAVADFVNALKLQPGIR